MSVRRWILVFLAFVIGLILELYGAIAAFGSIVLSESYEILVVTAIGGLASFALGYVSVVVFGGRASLGLVEFMSRFTRAKHVVEFAEEKPLTFGGRIRKDVIVVALPALVFLLSIGLGWDIHNLHDPRTSFFHPILHTLDIFSKPLIGEPLFYSIEIVLVMIFLVAIAGIVPTLVLPYFRRFKITGINSGPFHTDLLMTLVGTIVGLGAVLTLIGVIFEALWVGQGPSYYHFVIPVMMGLSLQYAIGALAGRTKAEDMVGARLEAHAGKRVVKGTVTVHPRTREGTGTSSETA